VCLVCLCLDVWVIRLVKRRYVDALGLISLAAFIASSLWWWGVAVGV
jgi:hypothetical protein